MDIETLNRYAEVKHQLDTAKKLEGQLRLEILEDMFPAANAGTFNEFVGHFKVKGTFRNTMSINIDEIEEALGTLSAEEIECIKWTPTIIVGNYNNLHEEDITGNLDALITTKPAMPSLKLEIEE